MNVVIKINQFKIISNKRLERRKRRGSRRWKLVVNRSSKRRLTKRNFARRNRPRRIVIVASVSGKT